MVNCTERAQNHVISGLGFDSLMAHSLLINQKVSSMKKVMVLAIMSLVLFSCKTLVKYQLNSTVVDYTDYTEKGFFMSEATSVSFDYSTIGSIRVESVSGYDISTEHAMQPSEYIIKQKEVGYSGKFISCNLDDAFRKLYETSIDRGANGVINIKMNYLSTFVDPYTKITYPDRWVVSGMMIKKLVK